MCIISCTIMLNAVTVCVCVCVCYTAIIGEVSDIGSGGERRSGSLVTSIDLEGLDVLRFRNNFLQVNIQCVCVCV